MSATPWWELLLGELRYERLVKVFGAFNFFAISAFLHTQAQTDPAITVRLNSSEFIWKASLWYQNTEISSRDCSVC